MMRPFRTLVLALVATPGMASAMGIEDDPFLWSTMLDQSEWRASDAAAWEWQGWGGRDLHKFWWKTEGEAEDGHVEAAEVQLLYSHAIAPYWDLQAGVRREFRPEPDRDWLVLGIQGLAPYFFEVDADLFVGESGRLGMRLKAHYEFLLTQRWVLSPEAELNAHSKDDPLRRVGDGVSSLELGLRLRYEIRRELAPYLGLHWEKSYGQTADYAREEGLDASELKFVVGLKAWF